MAYNQALTAYQKTGVETADNLKLIVMCYEVAINDLKEAQRQHEGHSMEAAYSKIRHAQDIITELLVALDYERGGEIAGNLGRIYNFVLRQLVGINSQQDTAVYGQLIDILAELKGAWEQIRQTGQQYQQPLPVVENRNMPSSARV